MIQIQPIVVAFVAAAAGTLAAAVASAWIRFRLGSTLVVGLAFLLGAWMDSGHPRWPMREDQDRFLGLVWPAAVFAECLAVYLPTAVAWCLRALLAMAIGPVLLLGTTYLTGEHRWTTAVACAWFGGMGALLMLTWAGATWAAGRLPQQILLWGLVLVNTGTGVVVMISGYATGGPMGLILAACLFATMLMSLLRRGEPELHGVIGLGIVGVFSVLVTGHFISSLSLPHALLLWLAVLLVSLPTWPGRLGHVGRALLMLVAMGVPLTVAGILAWNKADVADAETATHPTPGDEYSADDYKQFLTDAK
jgi:hypothetical protein